MTNNFVRKIKKTCFVETNFGVLMGIHTKRKHRYCVVDLSCGHTVQRTHSDIAGKQSIVCEWCANREDPQE
jgi:hypothetical protein